MQGLDRYAYANNNPIVYVDISGHSASCSGTLGYKTCTLTGGDIAMFTVMLVDLKEDFQNTINNNYSGYADAVDIAGIHPETPTIILDPAVDASLDKYYDYPQGELSKIDKFFDIAVRNAVKNAGDGALVVSYDTKAHKLSVGYQVCDGEGYYVIPTGSLTINSDLKLRNTIIQNLNDAFHVIDDPTTYEILDDTTLDFDAFLDGAVDLEGGGGEWKPNNNPILMQ